MSKCPGITAKGKPCQGYVHPGKTYCPAHDPARAEARKEVAVKAGRRRSHEFQAVKQELRQLANDVRSGAMNRADAAVIGQILGTWAKVAEAHVKLRQFEEVELPEFKEVVGRLEVLESAQAKQRERGHWAG